jgi:tetratricopeptide (TPR) repeat protein
MPIRFRRSIKLGKGLRLNVSKTGLGLSAGVRGARYSVHSSGRTTRSVGIPGSGVGFVSTSMGGGKRGSTSGSHTRRQQVVVPPQNAAAMLPKPGLFSSKAEKRYHEGVHAYLRGEHQKALSALDEVLAAEPTAVSAHLIAAICIGKLEGPDAEQIRHLETLIGSDAAMPDKLQAKYLPAGMVSLSLMGRVTEHINAEVPFDSVGATLLLAEHYQEAQRLEEAIGLVQQLHEANPTDPAIRLSLADLLLADDDFDGVVEAATGATNDSDLGAALLHLRAAALFALGHQTAALDSFRDALAKPSRDADLLMVIRYDRALAYEASGQHGRAKQDLERLFARDPGYLDVRERLGAVPHQAE